MIAMVLGTDRRSGNSYRGELRHCYNGRRHEFFADNRCALVAVHLHARMAERVHGSQPKNGAQQQ